MYRIFAGILPFWVAMIVCVAILVAFPQIALILPNTMYR
jgi:TRAP-type C4-dicarboxylate transport system permease large subunit